MLICFLQTSNYHYQLLLPQLLAIIPGDIGSHCSGDRVNDVEGKEEGSSPEAELQNVFFYT